MTPNTPSHNEEVGKIFSLIGSELEDYFNSQYPIPDHKVIMGYLGESLMDSLLVYRNSIESEVRVRTAREIMEKIEDAFNGEELLYGEWCKIEKEIEASLTTPVKPLQD
jgi:hypothetical protein